jgi:hypothetical protein
VLYNPLKSFKSTLSNGSNTPAPGKIKLSNPNSRKSLFSVTVTNGAEVGVIVGVIEGVIVIVGVTVGVSVAVTVTEGVNEIVGVIDTVGVTVGVKVIVGVKVGVKEIVGVSVGEGVNVFVGVMDGDMGIDGVDAGITLSRLPLATEPLLIILLNDKELTRNLFLSLCKSLLLGGMAIEIFNVSK